MGENTTKILSLDLEDYARLFYYRRGTDFQMVLYLFLLVGMNSKEIASLQWNNIDLDQKCIIIEEHIYPLTEKVMDFIKEYRRNQLEKFYTDGKLDMFGFVCYKKDYTLYTGEELEEKFKDYLVQCGYHPLSPEQVRNSFPMYLYEHDLVTRLIDMCITNSRIQKTI